MWKSFIEIHIYESIYISSDWSNEFTNRINDQIKTAIDNVVGNRHKIAHGRSITMSYHNISTYYNNVKKAVEILEEIIK